MAATSVKNNISYPRFSARQWWRLRRQFKKTIPGTITDSYLATVLETTPDSVKNNYISPLKKLGLIDGDNKTTERARRWREDEEYKSVCEEILHSIYPQELLDIGPDYNRTSVESWFGRSAGVGEKAKQEMTALFLLLVKGDPSEQDLAIGASKPLKNSQGNSSIPRSRRQEQKNASQGSPKEYNSSIPNPTDMVHERNGNSVNPSLHIDIQVHISPEAPADQIDRIFESMAKHLYQGKVTNGN